MLEGVPGCDGRPVGLSAVALASAGFPAVSFVTGASVRLILASTPSEVVGDVMVPPAEGEERAMIGAVESGVGSVGSLFGSRFQNAPCDGL